MKKELFMTGLLMLGTGAFAQDAPKGNEKAAVESAVTVKIQPRRDGWEESLTRILGKRCPNCGEYHGSGFDSLLKSERALEVPGFLISGDRVLIADTGIGLNEIASIQVDGGRGMVGAGLEKIFIEENGWLLKLEDELKGRIPAAAELGAGAAVCGFQPGFNAGQRLYVSKKPLEGMKLLFADGSQGLAFPGIFQMQDDAGKVSGYATGREYALEELTGTRGNPLSWKAMAPGEVNDFEKRIEARVKHSVLPVTLQLRAPKAKNKTRSSFYYGGSDDDDSSTEVFTIGIVAEAGRLVIPQTLDRGQMARLEGISVTLPGEEIKATFVCTLDSLAMILVDLEKELPDRVLQGGTEKLASLQALQFGVSVETASAGTYRSRIRPIRVSRYEKGWRNYTVAEFSGQREWSFVFSPEGTCDWVSIAVLRDSGSFGRSWSSSSGSDEMLVPYHVFSKFIRPDEKEINYALKPLSKDDEQALGWVGLDLQALDKGLAEANNVALVTKEGQFGGMVTQVYPGSPAERAGVEAGWVLTRILPKRQTVPQEVRIENRDGYGREFPWERLDEIPAQYLDDIPQPWAGFDTAFRKDLTNKLGIGASFTAEFFADGKRMEKELTIERAPAWFGNAKSITWKRAGLEVCNLTMDVREYLNLDADAPGIVIKRVRTGTPAAQAGLKPYELIVKVDGEPVKNVAAFTLAVKGRESVVLSVSRMGKDRVVTLTPKTEDDAPAEEEPSGEETP